MSIFPSASRRTRPPEIVRQTPVKDRKTGLALTVSTIRIARGHYDTVVFDDSTDKRHSGMVLAGHEHEGRQYGPYVIDSTNERADTRDEAMDQHREALYAARTEQPSPRGGAS
ncbi:hypothetical protein ACFYOY_13730 [Streptomyces sp. NPDC007875]|uniref:hypothetical protein n=1 Tax=Streptomyces sp. NPDC007875 TaxID=3364783 RepID=UPI0036A4B452